MKRFIVIILLLNTFSVFGQDQERQVGINILSDVNLHGVWRMGVQLTYTDQRHLLSIGIKPVYPAKFEFGLFGYDLNYRIYPHLPKNIVNPFFRAGIDYKHINNSITKEGTIIPYPTEFRDIRSTLSVNLGYGIDLNFTKNFYLSASINAAYVWHKSDQRIIAKTSPANIYGQIDKDRFFAPILLVSLGHHFSFKRKPTN